MISRQSPKLSFLLLLLAFTGGCALNGTLDSAATSETRSVEAVELWKTPFYPQSQYQCGPAALATVLTAAGTAVTPEKLVPEVYIPEKRGSLQFELVAASRRRGLIPYPIEPDFSHLVRELQAGRPVLVLQNLGFKRYPVWHYAVVIGYQPKDNRVLLRSGTHERLSMSTGKFRSTWETAGRWGVVVLEPGDFPESPDVDRYLGEVAALESLGHLDAAHQGYSAVLRRWPGNEPALLGLGNSHYGRGELQSSEAAYRNLIALHPGHPIAFNNLAQVLSDRGCFREARTAINHALADGGTAEELEAALLRTRAEIEAATGTNASNCPTVF